MGSLPELRGLITVTGFIAISIFLIGLTPPQFFVEEYEGLRAEPPEVFEGIELQSFAETCTFVMNTTDHIDKGQNWWMVELRDDVTDEWLGGHDLDFWYREPNATNLRLYINHWYAKWIVFTTSDGLNWINSKGFSHGHILYGVDDMDYDYTQNNTIQYTAKCRHLELRVFFGFNETLYQTPSHAWNSGELNVFVGIDFDQTATSYNAWTLVSKVLIFQLPETHWFLTALIAVPLWISIIYVAIILIYRAIEAIKPFS